MGAVVGERARRKIRNFGGGVLVVKYVLNNKSGCRRDALIPPGWNFADCDKRCK